MILVTKHALILLIITMLFIILSCSDDDTISSPTEIDTVTTSLSLTPNNVCPGDTVSISITIRNHTDEDIVVNFVNNQQVGYNVYLRGHIVTAYPTILEPTGSMRVLPSNSGLIFDMLLCTEDLASGLYLIRGGLLEHEIEYPWAMAFMTVK